MIGCVMVGTNDLARSTKFYDATLAPLNLIQVECLDIYTAYASKDARDAIELYVTKPFDQESEWSGKMLSLKPEGPNDAACEIVDLPFCDKDKCLPRDLPNLNTK